MTVPSSDIGPWEYTGNGVTTSFPYLNKVFAASEIEVYEDGVRVVTGYTVTGVGLPDGGQVEYAAAPAAGVTVTIVRNVADTQELDLVENDDQPSELLEKALDRRTIVSQQQSERLDRSLHYPRGEAGDPSAELPAKAVRANSALLFDSEGEAIAGALSDGSVTAVTAAGTTTSRSLAERAAEQINPRDDGAVGDGATDDRAAIAAADTLAVANGSSLRFSEGTYLVASDLTIAADCVFEPGAIIKRSASVTVTFTGAILTGPWQIFEGSGAGSFDLSKAAVDYVSVLWFGALADGRRFTGAMTDADKTLSSGATPIFSVNDEGKPAYVLGGGASVATISNAEDDGSGAIKITAVGHTLKNGGIFTIKGVAGTTEANDTWIIKIPLRKVTNAVNNGSGLIRLTTTGHPYSTNEKVTIFDVLGTTEANGDWLATKIDADTIDLQGSTFTNAYVSGGFAKLTDKITLKGSTFTNAYTSGGTIHGVLSTTVASFTSTTSVELSDAAGATVGGVAGILNALVGTDSSAAFTAALAAAGNQGGHVVGPSARSDELTIPWVGYIVGDLIIDNKERLRMEIFGAVQIKPGAANFIEFNEDTRQSRWCTFTFDEINGGDQQATGFYVESLAFSKFYINHMWLCDYCWDITTTGTKNTNDCHVDVQLMEFSNTLVRILAADNAPPNSLAEGWQFRVGLSGNSQIGYYMPGTTAGSSRYFHLFGGIDLCRLDNPGGSLAIANGVVDEHPQSRSIYDLTFGGNFSGPNVRGQGLASSRLWWGDALRWIIGKSIKRQWTDAVGNPIGDFRSDATADFGNVVFDNNGIGFQSPSDVTTARINFSDGFAAFGGAGIASALSAANDGAIVGMLNRETSDGLVLDIRRDNVSQGGVQVSSGTVSILAATMAHWSQSSEIDAETPIGTIVSATEDLCEWWAAEWTDREEDAEGNVTEYGRHEVVSHAGAASAEKRAQYPAAAQVVKEDNAHLTKCRITTAAKDPTVMGVHKFYDEDGDVTVAGSGHFIIRVGGEGGPIGLGDLICSSSTPGVGMNQGDDMWRSHTIAWARGSYDPTSDGPEKTIPCTLRRG